MADLYVVKNAQIVLENGIMWDGAIIVEDGKIKDYGKERDLKIPEDAEIIDAGGAYMGPGFVDIHVHGGGGFTTTFEPVEAANHFLRHGSTSILATPSYDMNTAEFVAATKSIKEGMKKTKVIKGIYMEGPYMNPNYGANSFNNPWRHGVHEEDFKQFVDEAGDIVKVWAIAPEVPNLIPFLEYARKVNPDVKFALGHSEATPVEVRALGTKFRPAIMTHTCDATGRRPVFEGTRNCGPDEYCFREPDMYAELISDSCGIHVNPEMQQLILHTKGVHHTVLITDSTEHDDPAPPQLSHVTDLNFDAQGGINGSKMTMDKACRNIMQSTNCGIAQAFLMASTNPAKAVGLEDKIGSIEIGKNADLVFVDDKFNVKKVILEGKIVVEEGKLI